MNRDRSVRPRQILILCSLLFSTDLFTNKAQFNTGYSERFKLKDDAVPTILNPMSHLTSVSKCFHYVITIALSVITDRLCTYLCVLNQNTAVSICEEKIPVGINFNLPHLFKQSVQMRGVIITS